MAIAIEDAGFEMRDMMGWKYEGQAKAFSQDHFIKKNKSLSDKEKETLLQSMKGWKTPQLKPQIEPMTLAQKPREGTFVDNWSKYGVGLLNTTVSLDGMFPGNIMEVSKQEKFHDEKYKIEHFTTKPVRLIEHIIKLFTQRGQIVFDSFCGSGSHGVAALRCGRKFIGVEREEKYFDIASKRLKTVQSVEDFYE
jgi:site-specific DNA-methyltransferase (adenine-specific)